MQKGNAQNKGQQNRPKRHGAHREGGEAVCSVQGWGNEATPHKTVERISQLIMSDMWSSLGGPPSARIITDTIIPTNRRPGHILSRVIPFSQPPRWTNRFALIK